MYTLNKKLYSEPNHKLYRKSNNVCVGSEYGLNITFFDSNGKRLSSPRWETIDDFYEKFSLDCIKENKIKELLEYDNSEELNSVIINGITFCFRKNDRIIFRNTIIALKAERKKYITLYSENSNTQLSIKEFENILNKLEMRALYIFRITEEKKQFIKNATTVEELDDIFSGYPEILMFEDNSQ